MASNKDFLNKLIAEARQKKFEREQSKDLIKSIGDEVKAQLTPKNVEDVAINMGNEIKDALVKSIGSLNLNDHVNSIAKGITIQSPEVKIPEIKVTVPEIKIPTINVPEPRVTVNVPDFPKIPDFPRIEMPNSMEVFGSLDLNYDYKNPLPVRLVSLDGKPYESVGGIMGGGGVSTSGGGSTTVSLVNVDGTYYNSDNPLPVTGTFSTTPGLQVSGAVDSVNVVDAFGSTAVSGVWNADNRLRVSVETGGSGLTDSELRASAVPVSQVSGSSFSVFSTFDTTSTYFNADNRLRVSVETGGSGLTDTELRASSVPVSQVSGSVDSVNITNASIAVTGTFWQATQPVSGTVAVSGVSGTLGSNIVDSSGVAYSGSNPLPISGSVTASGTVAVSDITNSIKSALIDSSGVQYSGSNPVPVGGAVSQSGTWNIGTVTAVTDITNPIQVRQISGAADSVSIVSITDIFSTTATSNVVTPDNRVKVDGSGVTQPVSGTLTVSSVTASVAANIVDSSGVAYTTSNPLPIGDAGGSVTIDGTITGITNAVEVRQVSGATDSVSVIGNIQGITNGVNILSTDPNNVSVASYQVSGAVWSTSVVSLTDIFSTTAASNVVNPDNRVKVELPTGSSSLTDTELRASAVPITQVSGASFSVSVTGATGTIATNMVDSSGIAYSGSNPVPVNMVVALDSVNDSIGVLQVSGTIDSVFVTGANDSFFVYEARTTNPTAKSDGGDVRPKADKLGRAITRPIQVRDLIKTAYTSVSNGTETTLLTASAGTYADLIMITATNNSSAATQLDIRCTSGGNIIHTMYLPATTGPVGWSPSVPWPQDATGNAWTIDMPDQTGTTVYVSALFSQEI